MSIAPKIICSVVCTVTGRTLYAANLPPAMLVAGAVGGWGYTQDVSKALKLTTLQKDIFCSDELACGRIATVTDPDATAEHEFVLTQRVGTKWLAIATVKFTGVCSVARSIRFLQEQGYDCNMAGRKVSWLVQMKSQANFKGYAANCQQYFAPAGFGG